MVLAVPLAGVVAAKDTVVVCTAIETERITDYMKAMVYPNDFCWSATNRDRILAEWSNATRSS